MTKLGSPIRDRCQLAILTGFLVCLITVFQPATTYADVTLFTGVNNTTANRPTSGFAIGMLFMKLVGFELEYASALEDPALGSPLLRTGMANVVVDVAPPPRPPLKSAAVAASASQIGTLKKSRLLS